MVQESFLAVGISNHSSLSGAYSKFLLKELTIFRGSGYDEEAGGNGGKG